MWAGCGRLCKSILTFALLCDAGISCGTGYVNMPVHMPNHHLFQVKKRRHVLTNNLESKINLGFPLPRFLRIKLSSVRWRQPELFPRIPIKNQHAHVIPCRHDWRHYIYQSHFWCPADIKQQPNTLRGFRLRRLELESFSPTALSETLISS